MTLAALVVVGVGTVGAGGLLAIPRRSFAVGLAAQAAYPRHGVIALAAHRNPIWPSK